MEIIDERPSQRKRKAKNAQAFATRYLEESAYAWGCGNPDKAEKLLRKSRYWLDRYNKLVGNVG